MAADKVSTRQRLVDATISIVGRQGIAAVSARTIAAEAGVSQGLVFYHFDSVENLLAESAAIGGEQHVAQWVEPLAAVTSLHGLVDLAQTLHETATRDGNVTVLAQFLAGSQSHPALAEATGAALARWADVIEPVVTRILGESPLAGSLDGRALSGLVADAFIGIELAAATRDEAQVQERFALLHDLASLVEVMFDLGPVAASALRRKLARASA